MCAEHGDYIIIVLLPHCHRFIFHFHDFAESCAKIQSIEEKIWHLITLTYKYSANKMRELQWRKKNLISLPRDMIPKFIHMIYSHNRFIGI